MSRSNDALVVRAAGLSTRLLDQEGRAAAIRATDFGALTRDLAARGYLAEEIRPDATALEVAIRRGASARLRQLARWDPEGPLGPLLFAMEDRRSLRALLRGAQAALPADVRLAGLLPTPTLPERVLAELARQPSVAAMVGLLALWRSPYAPALAPARSGPPDLLALEVALARDTSRRALEVARRQGGGWTDFVRESIDLDNLRTALTLTGRGDELEPATHFLEGGDRLTEDRFRQIATAQDPDRAVQLAARVWDGTPLHPIILHHGRDPLRLERELDEARRQLWRRRARREPLGAAPIVSYLLRLRAEGQVLQRAVWGLALGAPALRRQAAGGEGA